MIAVAAYLDALNPDQRRAVEHGMCDRDTSAAPPLLVIAGAGSGKTNTQAHRVAHLIVHSAYPRRILLMTFSRRAAAEMTQRVERIARRVTTFQDLREAVSTHTSRAAEKMRRQSFATAHLVVFVHTNPFKPNEPQYDASRAVRLPVATADTSRLLKAAKHALAAIWKPGYNYKKAGVILLDLLPASRVQGDLWDQSDTTRNVGLMRAIDTLNGRYGPNTVVYASAGKSKAWNCARIMCRRLHDRF